MVRFARVGVAAFSMYHPRVIRSHQLTRHNGGNTLKSQGNRKGLRALPLNWVECGVFYMLTRHEPYHELGAHYFDARRRHSTVDRLAQRIERLGYRVHLEPVATTAG